MQSAIHVTTTILPGGKIEIPASELPAGRRAEVIVLLTDPDHAGARSAVDILAEAPGHRIFQTAEEVDSYVREERDSWDR
jgi:hypothetical protein